jgi:hypothetical protein
MEQVPTSISTDDDGQETSPKGRDDAVKPAKTVTATDVASQLPQTAQSPQSTPARRNEWKTRHPTMTSSLWVTIKDMTIYLSPDGIPVPEDTEKYSYGPETMKGTSGYALYDNSTGERVSFVSNAELGAALAGLNG